MAGMKLGTKILLGVLMVIAGMTLLTVFLGSDFIGQEVHGKTVANLARTRSNVHQVETGIHASLTRANDVMSELATTKAAAANGHPETLAHQITTVLRHTEADLFFWIQPGPQPQGPKGPDGSWPDSAWRPSALAAFLDQREGREVAYLAARTAPEPADLFSFGASSGEVVTPALPERLSGTGWPVRPIPDDLAAAPLVDVAVRRCQMVQRAVLEGRSDKEALRGEQVIASYQGGLYLVAFRPWVFEGGGFVGILGSAAEITDQLAHRIASATGSGVAYLRRSPAGEPLVVASSARVGSGPHGDRAPLYATMLRDQRLIPGPAPITVEAGGREYVVQAAARETASGSDAALVVLEGDLTAEVGSLLASLKRSLLQISSVIAVLAIFLLHLALRAWVARPVEALNRGMIRIQDGVLNETLEVTSNDEMGELAQSYNEMLVELRKKEQYMRMVSKSAVDAVESQVTADLAGGGERRVVTMLFSDIRGFTTLCEGIDPNKLVHLLNRYFDAMVEIIYRHGGVLDKFIGDAIMAIFEKGDHPKNAVLAALEMQEEVARLDREEGLGLRIGVGLHTGEVIAGFVGAKEFMNHTYLGDAVNVAARLESESKNGKFTQVIVSDDTLNAVPGLVEVERLAKQHVKGKAKAVVMYEVVRLLQTGDLVEALSSEDTGARLRAVRAVARLGGDERVDLLLPHVSDEDPDIAIAAILGIKAAFTLGDEGASDEILGALFEKLAEEERVPVRASLVSALGFSARFESIERLRPLLEDGHARIRANVIEALQRLGAATVRRLVRPLLMDENNRVRANAAITLFEDDPDGVANLLIEGLRSSSAYQRASSAYAVSVVAGRYPAELLDPERARDLDQQAYRVHRVFRTLAGVLTTVLHEERDRMVLRNLVPALNVLLGPDTVGPLVQEVSARRKDEGDQDSVDELAASSSSFFLDSRDGITLEVSGEHKGD